MPKLIITEKSLPIALHEIDKWSGKLTWERFAERLAIALGEKRISRHTLLSYQVLVEAFNAKKDALREAATNLEPVGRDITLDFAKQQITILEAKVNRLEKQNSLLSEQFVRWQNNLYMMPGVDMEKVKHQIDKPLPSINRR